MTTVSGSKTEVADEPAVVVPAAGGPRSTSRRIRFRRDRVLLALLVPGLVYFLIFHYVALAGNVIAFQDFVPFLGFGGSEWVGWENFRKLLSDPAILQALSNTLQISALQLVFYFPAPIALAIFLNSVQFTWVRKAVQSVVYLPHFISWVVVVALRARSPPARAPP